jgi:RimJ/RimL family protein N-acetyltransferase
MHYMKLFLIQRQCSIIQHLLMLKEQKDGFLGIQNIDGEMLPEIGYHIHKKYWRKGFGKEAAIAVRDWAFEHTDYDIIYSYMKYTNVGSYNTAIANGMKRVKVYADSKNTISYAYAITKAEWEKLR